MSREARARRRARLELERLALRCCFRCGAPTEHLAGMPWGEVIASCSGCWLDFLDACESEGLRVGACYCKVCTGLP